MGICIHTVLHCNVLADQIAVIFPPGLGHDFVQGIHPVSHKADALLKYFIA